MNSRKIAPQEWLKALKSVLNHYGKEPQQWEIYRGDSFQLEVTLEQAIDAALHIKATIKQFKNLDVRLAIGIGDKTYTSDKITESNGSAFINSGECFESLKKNTLAIKSPFSEIDQRLNIMLQLASLTIDNWTTTSSSIIKTKLEHPELNQEQIAQLLKKSQGNISEGLKRGGFDEIQTMMLYYKVQFNNIKK